MVITQSARLRAGTYRFPAPKDGAAITVRGTDITVDLRGVTLEGGEPLADPDSYTGVGVFIDGGRGITVRNGTIRGYKVGILAKKSSFLRLTGNDASYNWRPRLWSGIERESLADWLSYHDNDQDEWLRYGAAYYLSECDSAEVDNNRAVQGQNGLLITRSLKARIFNNTFSWMSGVGLGLYRTSDSLIQHNKLDWNVRGYSHGHYNRGQDSAGLLMYEQSSRNTVAYNSVTHGGDGLFLWAGQTTLNGGQGGSNDNRFTQNDFSHAVANGIEATFSRNVFVGNRIDDSWHGVWAGYSYDTVFAGNSFSGNGEAIAIEHGQNIQIRGNSFRGDETAIRLWSNPGDPGWGYTRHKDTRSRDYVIEGNRFEGTPTAVNILRTTGVRVKGNAFASVGNALQIGSEVGTLEFEPPGPAPAAPDTSAPPKLVGAIEARLPEDALRGRSTIVVDEWGPYDYRSPKLWPVGKLADRPLRLRVLGPVGKWSLKSIRGGTPSTREGVVPGELSITLPERGIDLEVTLEYVGGPVLTPRGQGYTAGARVPVTYTLFEPAIDWTVMFWKVETPTTLAAVQDIFSAAFKTSPLRSEAMTKLDFLTAGPISTGLPNDGAVLRADGVVTLPPGSYEMSVISDDGVRVWLDGKLVIDRWSVHASAVDRVLVPAGKHQLKVEYFEATGFAELQVRFWRKMP